MKKKMESDKMVIRAAELEGDAGRREEILRLRQVLEKRYYRWYLTSVVKGVRWKELVDMSIFWFEKLLQ